MTTEMKIGRMRSVAGAVALVLVAGATLAACASDEGAQAGRADTATPDTATPDIATSVTPTSSTLLVGQVQDPPPKGPVDSDSPVDQKAPLGINGLIVLGDRIYAACGRDNQVLSIDPTTGMIMARFGAGDELGWPDDLDALSDGSLLVTGMEGGRVSRISPDGALSVVADLGVGVNPILTISDTEVLVGKAISGDGLWRLNPETEQTEQIATSLDFVNSFDLGPDGTLIGPRMGTGKQPAAVVSIDLRSGKSTDVVATTGLLTALEVVDNVAYVLNAAPPALYRVDLAADDPGLDKVVDLPVAPDNLEIDADGSVWISDFASNAILHVVGTDITTIKVGA